MTIRADGQLSAYLQRIKDVIDQDGPSAEKKLLDILRGGSNTLYELRRGEQFVWPLRFTAVLVRQADDWRFLQMQFSFPTTRFPDERQRKTCGVPVARVFQRKIDLGLQMLERARANGLDRVACDAFYGRDREFRAELQAKNVLYAADVPANTQVYRREPRVGVRRRRHHRGPLPPAGKS